VVESEAATVRHIFRRYLEFGSLNLLLSDLRAGGVTTRIRILAGGRTVGGIPLTRGPLAYLRNRFTSTPANRTVATNQKKNKSTIDL
jgi:site-specific DNA recombinase